MELYQYHEKAINCLVQNKLKLGITEEVAREILLELDNRHSIDDWETEWLTYVEGGVYFGLKCINIEQKVRLWDLVGELKEYFETIAPRIRSREVHMLLTELQAYI
jgi:hypothetical protein